MDFRKKIGIFVMAGAIVLAGFLLFSPSNKPVSKNNQAGAVNPTAEPFQLEKDTEKLGINSNTPDLSGLLSNLNSSGTDKNLTENFAETLNQGLIQANGQNFDPAQGVKTPGQEFVWNQFLQQIQNKNLFDQGNLDLKELNIDSDNSKEKVKDYFSALTEILQNYRSQDLNSLTKSLEAFTESQDPNYLLPVLNSYDQLVQQLKKLKVPSDWASLHLELVNLIGAEREIFASFANYQEDPLKAIIASESFSSLSERELNLFLKIGEKLEKEGLADYLNKELKGFTNL